MARKGVGYVEKTIQTHDPLARISLRIGMYIGVLIKEVDNAVDKFIMGEGKRIEITRDGDTVRLRD